MNYKPATEIQILRVAIENNNKSEIFSVSRAK
jgi:hypothetical protein